MKAAQPGLSPGARFVLSLSASGMSLWDLVDPTLTLPAVPPSFVGTALAVDGSGRKLASWRSESDQVTVCDLGAGGRCTTLQWPPATPPMRDSSLPGQGQLLSSDLAPVPAPCAGTGNAAIRTPANGGDIGNAWTGNAATGDAPLHWGDTVLVWDWAKQRVAMQVVVADELRAGVLAFPPLGRASGPGHSAGTPVRV